MSKRVPSPHKASSPSFIRQVVGSLLAALLIVILTVLVVTAKLGPGLDAREQRELQDQREELQERRQEQREERLEAATDEPPGVGTGATIG
jgi:cell shape-determining protein MreC